MFNPEELAFTHNNSPSERLSDLSPIQFFELTHNSFLQNSPVKLYDNIVDEIYDKIPFLKLVESFVELIKQDGFIKQTATGRIPVKILTSLYNQKHLTDQYIENGINKLSSENYWPIIIAVKTVCKKAGITRLEKNKIVLVKKNLAFLDPENREALFRTVYLNYSENFNWAYFDGYPNIPAGQYGVNFSIYLLLRFGNIFREDSFYSQRYLKGYPNFAVEFKDEDFFNSNSFDHCYSIRTFDRFTNWFGLTETREIEYGKKEIIATNLLVKIFKLDY